ncbi:hypothetical protein KIN20_025914 [Parelaphostrongylus tenuis]|uniref:FMN hydroxy acid dehydrogenase domain-containing protein n=1 Tax=Parelaphostrongylus tenuis TaxID=148309 RepID=A0AAD5QXU6_PARTN|nr:hypothetical protein KIN20_025914 [Parelaphostrongylus tenuis]
MPDYRSGIRPLLTVDDFRLEAGLNLKKMASDYYEAGADEQLTLTRNEAAFRRSYCFVLTNLSLLCASVSDSVMIVSSWSTTALEEVAEQAANDGAELWFQLYVYKERSITSALVTRAEKSGYKAIVLTVDTPVLGRRLIDARNAFTLPDGLRSDLNGIAVEQSWE